MKRALIVEADGGPLGITVVGANVADAQVLAVTIDAIGQYRDGKKIGTWKRWDAEGFRNWTESYKDGQRVS